MKLAAVLALTLAACTTSAPSSTQHARVVSDPLQIVPCDASWSLPVKDPQCEQACVPRPALHKTECQAWNDAGMTQHCTGTFTFDDDQGVPHTGCCGLGGDQTHPTVLRFAECE